MSISIVESVPVATNTGAQLIEATLPKRKVLMQAKANRRAKKVALASRGALLKSVPSDNIEDDVLLADVTTAARDALSAETSLTGAVTACCDADIDREEVQEAIVAGGWSDSRARTLVSAVYCAAGKRVRKVGAGRETPRAAIGFADYMLEKSESRSMAIKLARAALRYLIALEQRANDIKRPVETVKAPVKN